ncbi:MAG TPA: AbrB/MazE/SpoVT family DNA-binding domain-containing protein [Dermatophilaceae bacterium]
MPPISDYAARVLTARAAASNAPHRPTGAPAPYLLPGLLPAVPAPPRCAHALTAIDDHGRTRPGGLVAPLAWTPKTPLVCAVTDAAAVLTADPSGVPLLDPQGRLCLPLAARRALGLAPGSRVLLTVSPGRLTVQPATVLDTLTAVTNA